MTTTKRTWQSLARVLRRRGWNYQRVEWLLDDVWRVSVQRLDSHDESYEEVSAERKTPLGCYAALIKETSKARVV